MIKKINELNLLEPEEIPCFLNYAYPENKKSLNFPEFSSKVRPNALMTDEMGRQIYIPYTTPAPELTKSLQKILPRIKETVLTSQQFFTPKSKEGTFIRTIYFWIFFFFFYHLHFLNFIKFWKRFFDFIKQNNIYSF